VNPNPTSTPDPLDNLSATADRWRIIRFAILFTILVTFGSLSELYLIRSQQIPSDDGTVAGTTYQQFVAKTVTGVLNVFGVPAKRNDTNIRIHTASIEVAVECTGIKATAIFCGGVIAFPCAWRMRGVGLVVGLAGVGLLNIGRIILLAVVAAYRDAWFDSVHAVLMQGFLIAFVAPLWVAWMLLAVRNNAARQRSTPPQT
jgi:exosortase/archaeosortase family protein